MLDAYKVCIQQLGPTKKFKKKKAMWEGINSMLTAKQGEGYKVTTKQIINKVTALERGFKRVRDNNSQTGRSRARLDEPEVIVK